MRVVWRLQNCTLVDVETGEYSTEDILLWDSTAALKDAVILSPKCKVETNKASQASFTILPSHRAYDKLVKMQTLIIIEINGRVLFRGRIIDIVTDLYKQKNITCESDYAFFLDSMQFPYNGDAYERRLTIKGALSMILNQHALATKYEPWKHFRLGVVTLLESQLTETPFIPMRDPITEPVESIFTFDWDDFSITNDILTNNILQKFGGILQTRTEIEDGQYVAYLDYLEDPFAIEEVRYKKSHDVELKDYEEELLDAVGDEMAINSQDIKFGVNLVDAQGKFPISDLFTVLLPLGKDNLLINAERYVISTDFEGIHYGGLITSEALRNGGWVDGTKEYLDDEHDLYSQGIYIASERASEAYGYIIHIQQWSEIEDPVKLLEIATRYAKGHARAFPNDLTIRAVDLIHLDPNVEEFKMGDYIRVSIPHLGINDVLYCLAIDYDFQKPENTSYQIGSYIPADEKLDAVNSGGGGGGGGGGESGGNTMSEKSASSNAKAGRASAKASSAGSSSADPSALKLEGAREAINNCAITYTYNAGSHQYRATVKYTPTGGTELSKTGELTDTDAYQDGRENVGSSLSISTGSWSGGSMAVTAATNYNSRTEYVSMPSQSSARNVEFTGSWIGQATVSVTCSFSLGGQSYSFQGYVSR